MQWKDKLREGPIYEGYRVHTSLRFDSWTSVIVSTGKRRPITAHSLRETVTRVPGETPSEVAAIQAA